MLELTGFLGLTRISFFFAHTDPTDPTLLLCGWEISQMLLCVGGSCEFHFAFGLTRISQIPLSLCGWEISQMLLCVSWLTRIPLGFGLTRISQIPQYRFVGGKSHRWFCVWAGSHGFRLVFGLTRISQIPQYCFVGGKSHRCFYGWEISQMALWVWAPGGCTGLALTDLSFGPFGQIRPIGQIGRIGHF